MEANTNTIQSTITAAQAEQSEATQAKVKIYDTSEAEAVLVDTLTVNLSEGSNTKFQFVHLAERFYHAIQYGFIGNIKCTTDWICPVYESIHSTTMLIPISGVNGGIQGEITNYCE